MLIRPDAKLSSQSQGVVDDRDSDELIREYATIAHSLNALVERRTGTQPMLAGADFYPPTVLDLDWSHLGRRIDTLSSHVSALSTERAAYLRDCLDAFALMVREGQGEQVPYRERVATYLQVPAAPVDQDSITTLELRLAELLAQAGYGADVGSAIRRWSEDQRIEGQVLLTTARTWMDAARTSMRRRLMDVPEHTVTISLLDNYPHYAYSEFLGDAGGQVRLSNDISWTRVALKHSICHEGFPGHQAFSVTRRRLLDNGGLPPEAAIYFANTPVTPIDEGWAECGTEVLGWITSIDDQIFATYNSLCFAVSTNIAFECNEASLSRATAISRLMDKLHVPSSWAEQRYVFITHPLWSTSFPHYWYGRQIMRSAYERMGQAIEVFARMVYGQLHTVKTLGDAIERYLDSPPEAVRESVQNKAGGNA
jgi:hypothetical protein